MMVFTGWAFRRLHDEVINVSLWLNDLQIIAVIAMSRCRFCLQLKLRAACCNTAVLQLELVVTAAGRMHNCACCGLKQLHVTVLEGANNSCDSQDMPGLQHWFRFQAASSIASGVLLLYLIEHNNSFGMQYWLLRASTRVLHHRITPASRLTQLPAQPDVH